MLELTAQLPRGAEPVIALDDVHLARAGDRDAWLRLVRASKNLVTAIALGTVNDVATSEDIAQDVYLQAWLGLRRLKSADSFLPWLRQLTRNRATDAVRQRVRRARVFDHEGNGAEVADEKGDPQGQLLSREEQLQLQEALEALAPEPREVLVLFYREGQSVAQVATLLELSEQAVRKRLSRAREQLRSRLDESLLSRSTPGEQFCAMVVAAAGALPSTGGAAGAALLKGALGAWAGALAGATLAATAVLYGFKKEARAAFDEAERRELRRLRNVTLGLVAVTLAGATAAASFDMVRAALVVLFLYSAAMSALLGLWLPRIHRRREANELRTAADPEATRRKFLLVRRRSLLGLALGLGCSLVSVLWLSWSGALDW